MSILKALQDFLLTYDGMILQKVEGDPETGITIEAINTDITEETPGNYAVMPTGDSLVSRDILGNVKYSNDYVFYARAALADEVDRQDNHVFLEGFKTWINKQDKDQNFPIMPVGYIAEEIEVSNGILWDVGEDFTTGLYQIQIKLNYKKLA